MSGAGGSIKRLQREFKNIQAAPIREFLLYPMEDNMFEWHFTMMGPPDSPYQEGFYHGRILVPTNYPFAPPDVVLITPNGRFELEKRICLSISSYHPENWHPTWGISTVLHALREFMLTPGNNAIGAIDYPDDIKRKMALDSKEFVCKDCGTKISEHIEILMSNPPATEANKKKEQVMSTPDLSAQKTPNSGIQASTPAVDPKKTNENTTSMVREMTPMGLPPSEVKPGVDADCVTPTPAATSENPAFPSDPDDTESRKHSEADESDGTIEANDVEGHNKTEEAENKAEEADNKPESPAPVPAQEPPVVQPPLPRPAIERRNQGLEINISVSTLDRALFFIFCVIGLLCLKKIFINYEGSLLQVQEALRLL